MTTFYKTQRIKSIIVSTLTHDSANLTRLKCVTLSATKGLENNGTIAVMFSFAWCLSCPSASLALQRGSFVPRE